MGACRELVDERECFSHGILHGKHSSRGPCVGEGRLAQRASGGGDGAIMIRALAGGNGYTQRLSQGGGCPEHLGSTFWP